MSRLKITYLKCGFSGVKGSGQELTMVSVAILRTKKFGYFGLIIKEKGYIDKDIIHHIRVGRRNASILSEYCVIRKLL